MNATAVVCGVALVAVLLGIFIGGVRDWRRRRNMLRTIRAREAEVAACRANAWLGLNVTVDNDVARDESLAWSKVDPVDPAIWEDQPPEEEMLNWQPDILELVEVQEARLASGYRLAAFAIPHR